MHCAGLNKEQPMPFPPTYYQVSLLPRQHCAGLVLTCLTSPAVRPAADAQLTPAEMADNNYPLPVLDAASGELRCPPGFVVTQPCGQGIARSPAHDMLVRSVRDPHEHGRDAAAFQCAHVARQHELTL
jgi:hypothetical protein